LFFLLSIFFFVRWLRARDLDEKIGGGWNYALTLLFAALAMASKSSTVVLPIVLCLCSWWMEGRWQWRNLARVIPVFLMSATAGALSIWTQGLALATAPDPPWVRTWPERLVAAGDAVWFYLGKLLWPHPLITVYPRWKIDAGQWVSYLPLLAVVIVLFILWWKCKTWSRPYFFTFAYFLAALLPVLGLIDNAIFRYSLVFDHFQYLAGMGPLALAGAGMARLADFAIPGRSRLQSSLCAGLLLVLGLLTWQRSWAYESEETLWTDTLTRNPKCWVAYNNLGDALFRKNLLDEAMVQFQKALEINPDYAEARYNLGVALSKKGHVDKSIDQYERALEINPIYAQAHYNLGVALSQKGQEDDAMAQYQMALLINPNEVEARISLGNALFQKGLVDEAIVQFQKALETDPNSAGGHYNLGVALSQKGQVDEAIEQYQKAVEINPNDVKVRNSLGIALFQKGRVDEAVTQFKKAVAITPTYSEAHNSLGIALFRRGHLDEAIAQFEEALRIDPANTDVQNNLARAQAMTRPGAAQK
jgi:tetratricopeptide (TPR) repeat protein